MSGERRGDVEPLTAAEEAFLAETWSASWMTRDVKECRAALRRYLDAARADAGRATAAERYAANAILDRPSADPDDDPAIVARAMLRLARADAGRVDREALDELRIALATLTPGDISDLGGLASEYPAVYRMHAVYHAARAVTEEGEP